MKQLAMHAQIDLAGRRARQRAAALALLEDIIRSDVLTPKAQDLTFQAIARLRDPINPGRKPPSF